MNGVKANQQISLWKKLIFLKHFYNKSRKFGATLNSFLSCEYNRFTINFDTSSWV